MQSCSQLRSTNSAYEHQRLAGSAAHAALKLRSHLGADVLQSSIALFTYLGIQLPQSDPNSNHCILVEVIQAGTPATPDRNKVRGMVKVGLSWAS